jgi:hypothetical protein
MNKGLRSSSQWKPEVREEKPAQISSKAELKEDVAMIEAQASLPSEKGEKMTSARMISELIQKNKNITQIEIEEKLKHGISLICDDPLSN